MLVAMSEAHDSVRLGAYLFVAAGQDGVRVVDISNPAKPFVAHELKEVEMLISRALAVLVSSAPWTVTVRCPLTRWMRAKPRVSSISATALSGTRLPSGERIFR